VYESLDWIASGFIDLGVLQYWVEPPAGCLPCTYLYVADSSIAN